VLLLYKLLAGLCFQGLHIPINAPLQGWQSTPGAAPLLLSARGGRQYTALNSFRACQGRQHCLALLFVLLLLLVLPVAVLRRSHLNPG